MKSEHSKILLIITSIAFSIIAFSIAYYFVIFLPSAEKFKQDQVIQQQRRDREKAMEEQIKQRYYTSCQTEAANAAMELLKKKVEIDPSNTIWKQASEKDLYLKDDYNSYYEQCLAKYGLK